MFVIRNPVAAGGRARRRWDAVFRELSSAGVRFEHAATTRAGEAIDLATRAITAGHRVIGACGGDGTLHEVANAVLTAGADASVAFFPTGSSCDFAKAIAHRAFAEREPRRVDVIRIEMSGRARYAVNYTSIGLMAEATERFNRRGWAHAFGVDAAAIAATVRALLALRSIDATLRFDGGAIEHHSLMNLTLFKTRYVGGNMHFDVPVEADDGRMFAAALRPSSKRALIGIIPALYRGTVLQRDDTWSRSCVTADLATGAPTVIEADGEIIGVTPATFTVMPRALSVLA